MMEVVAYLTSDGRSPFEEWFARLDATVAARVVTALTRIERGLLSDVKSVGKGVFEYRIHGGPGVRLYFGRDGDSLVVLLAAGTKKQQRTDIRQAQTRWQDYKERKAKGNEPWH